jgi:predicted dehydrogenase/threonine dehydrogenase-like Zn-dependent dehydrogenase
LKQILQSLRTGAVEVADVPAPKPAAGRLLIRTSCSLVSAGTERMLADFGKAGFIGKARQQPEKVRQVLDKVRTDGLQPTLDAVFNKLDQPLPLGYCNVGRVIGIGAGVTGFAPGDRVISNGRHAEIVTVPVNLAARVPNAIGDEAAAFTVLGAIALQGIRLVQPTLGEAVVVTGLGLIGLMTVQLLRAQGCRVLGIDHDADRLALARGFGAEVIDLSAGSEPQAVAEAFSRGRGVDAVIIAASTTSDEPVHQAAQMCRKRGRIVLVGVTGLALSRADFYEKELSFQVSCSYGPGRYDPAYEDKGHDYPIGFVRWTEQRNFEAVLDMLADRRLDVNPLISHRFRLEQAASAYAVVGGAEPSLGILLEYPPPTGTTEPDVAGRTVHLVPAAAVAGKALLGFIGAGNYATAVLIPAFAATGARLKSVASSGGVSARYAGRKFGIEAATTDVDRLLADPSICAVVVSTRHDSHAGYVCQALKARKHVFVEKPLALTADELSEIEATRAAAIEGGFTPILAVGFNRRFAPHVRKMKALLSAAAGPKAFVMTVNAGAIPPDHWTQDREVGGGRILGEACHFIDLLRFLADAPIVAHSILGMPTPKGDTATIDLAFADGSIGAIHYFANGSKAFPKERLEVFAGGRVLQLDNFRRLTGFGWPGFHTMRLLRQDKGQKHCALAFVQAIETGGPAPIPFDELMEVSRVTVGLAEGLR